MSILQDDRFPLQSSTETWHYGMPGSPAAWSSAPGPVADWLSLTINSDFFDMFVGFNRYRASMSCIWNERNLAYLVFWCNKNILFVLPCLKLTNITPEKWAETQKERIVSHLAILRGDVSFREGIVTTNLPSNIYIYLYTKLVSIFFHIYLCCLSCLFLPRCMSPPPPWKEALKGWEAEHLGCSWACQPGRKCVNGSKVNGSVGYVTPIY